ncbi:MAG: hypothetical protein E7256_15705 [Lachnospiraceae bacterium]|nr:hypothetical protein [Lachnospiraceae bacterium]
MVETYNLYTGKGGTAFLGNKKERVKESMRKFQKKRSIAKVLIFAGMISLCSCFGSVDAYAGSENTAEDTASLRFIFTTDLHGMISSVDYEAGTDFKSAGLARAYNLILKTKSEMPEENVYLFDLGDVLYDATTEYIMEQDSEVTQPLYLAMAYIGYDAITLGNHEFDYGRDYLLAQLNGANLMDKVVVSNLLNSKDDTYPFNRNMIITRNVKTANGETVAVNVGVIGETIPTLSGKTDNYKGTWKTEDIVANVTKEAAALKEQGADIIVVLSHSGFGEEEPAVNAGNVSYALTKIPEVDVVLCGHEHNNFPGNGVPQYYALSGVDAKTGLVNGKTLVMAANQGKAIGVADLTLSVEADGNYEIIEQKGSVRKVSSYKTTEDANILAFFDDWRDEFESYRSNVIAKFADDTVIESYFGLLGDTVAMQLQNEARIAYALKYLQKNKKSYLQYPIIAASSYVNFGANSYDDYANISGEVTQSDLVALQKYRQYTGLYTIKGSQLREWIEWSASAYAQTNGKTSYTNSTLESVKDKTNLSFLISEEWQDDWTNFMVFDGVSYTIDASTLPRYDINGNKINNTTRVKSLKYNGKEVTNDQVFVIACNTLASATSPVLSWASSQLIYSKYRTQNIIAEYLEVLGNEQLVSLSVDNNWTLTYPNNYEFLLKASSLSTDSAKKTTWYQKTVLTEGNYNYYTCKYNNTVTSRPMLVVMPATTDPIRLSTEIYAMASSGYELTKFKYAAGNVAVDSMEWQTARDVTNNKVTAYFNGTYTFYAEDAKGNKVTQVIMIDNINVDGMAVPKCKTFHNRSKTLYGTAEPGTMVVIETPTKTYETKVLSNGSFSCNLEAQPSGTEMYVYAKDESSKRQSEKVKVRVKKAGPNQPSVNAYYNNNLYITGNTGDDDAYVAVVSQTDRIVYVSAGAADTLAMTTDMDLTKYTIVETEFQLDEEHNFSIATPEFEVGTSLVVYNLDHVGRLSRAVSIKVQDGGPTTPELYNICAIEKSISGNSTSSKKNAIFGVYAVVNGTTYKANSNKKGEFTVSFANEQLVAGQVIEVYVQDTVNGVVRRSRSAYITVSDTETMVDGSAIKIQAFAYGAKEITAVYTPNELIYISIPTASGNKMISGTTDDYGYLTVPVSEILTPGASVYALVRFDGGNIVDVAQRNVPYPAPMAPYILDTVDNTTTTIRVASDEHSSITLYANWKTYTSEMGVYDAALGVYVHTFTIKKPTAGKRVSVYAKNPSAKSSVVKYTVAKKVPAAPVVTSELKAGATEITGTTDIFLTGVAAPTVENTGTKVYVKIWKKTYEAAVNDDGTFTVTVWALKEGSKITVWTTNESGTGVKAYYTVGT